jgi:lipid A ethanolaminephosphotransferase
MPPKNIAFSKMVKAANKLCHYRPVLNTEQLVLWIVVILSVFYNIPFWQQALEGYDLFVIHTWLTFANMLLVMICLNFFSLC